VGSDNKSGIGKGYALMLGQQTVKSEALTFREMDDVKVVLMLLQPFSQTYV
jgi:hypothetical protein